MPQTAATAAIDEVPELEAFTVEEVARRISMSTSFVYRRIRSGELGHVRTGNGPKPALRVLASQLQRYLDAHRVDD